MKKVIIGLLLVTFLFAGCAKQSNQSTQTNEETQQETSAATELADAECLTYKITALSNCYSPDDTITVYKDQIEETYIHVTPICPLCHEEDIAQLEHFPSEAYGKESYVVDSFSSCICSDNQYDYALNLQLIQ